MARIRTIKPEFWRAEQVTDCSPNARLLFIGLWNFCDDRGVMPLKPKTIKASIYPADDFSSTDIRRMLDELSSNELIGTFEGDDGQEYLWVTGWKAHQKVDRPNPKYPAPPDKLDKSRQLALPIRRAFDERSPPEGKGREGSLREGRGGAFDDGSPNGRPAAAPGEERDAIPDGCEPPRPFTGPSAEALAIVAAFDAAIERHHGAEHARLCPTSLDRLTAQRWLDAGASQALCEMVFEGVMQRMAAKGKRPLKSLKALDEDISDAIAAAAKPLPQGRQQGQPQGGAMSSGMPMPVHKPDPALLAKGRDRQVGHYRDGGKWNPDFGPAPDDFGPDGVSRCLADPNELAKHGYGPRNPKPAQGASP